MIVNSKSNLLKAIIGQEVALASRVTSINTKSSKDRKIITTCLWKFWELVATSCLSFIFKRQTWCPR